MGRVKIGFWFWVQEEGTELLAVIDSAKASPVRRLACLPNAPQISRLVYFPLVLGQERITFVVLPSINTLCHDTNNSTTEVTKRSPFQGKEAENSPGYKEST